MTQDKTRNFSNKKKIIKVILAGGGTGGHLFPAFAISEALKKQLEKCYIHFVGSRYGLEAVLFQKHPEPFSLLPIRGFARGKSPKSAFRNLSFPLRFLYSYAKSRYLLFRIKPDVVVGTGGYASGLPLLAAIHKKIPTVIHEQNSYPGFTTRWLASRVNTVCLGYAVSQTYFKKNLVVTGNPVRENLVITDKQNSLSFFHLSPDKPALGILGGSQGSEALNRIVAESLNELSGLNIQILWQTGGIHHEKFAYLQRMYPAVRILPFIDEIGHFYSAVDLVVSRAGAVTLAELTFCGKPAILIPFPSAAADHQTTNAKMMVDAQAGVLIPESQLTSLKLVEEIKKLIFSPERLKAMMQSASSLSQKDAAEKIVGQILKAISW